MSIKKPDQKCLDCPNLFRNKNGRKFRCDSCQKPYAVEHAKLYRKQNPPDKIRQKINNERYRRRHPERIKHNQRKYRFKNLELCRKRTRESQIILNDKKRFGGLRIKALKRDNYRCQKCDKDVSGNFMALVHHLNHNKSDNRLDNFETLCHSCHARLHFHSDGHLLKYQFTSKQMKDRWKRKKKVSINK